MVIIPEGLDHLKHALTLMKLIIEMLSIPSSSEVSNPIIFLDPFFAFHHVVLIALKQIVGGNSLFRSNILRVSFKRLFQASTTRFEWDLIHSSSDRFGNKA
jgi:hypothetical protein